MAGVDVKWSVGFAKANCFNSQLDLLEEWIAKDKPAPNKFHMIVLDDKNLLRVLDEDDEKKVLQETGTSGQAQCPFDKWRIRAGETLTYDMLRSNTTNYSKVTDNIEASVFAGMSIIAGSAFLGRWESAPQFAYTIPHEVGHNLGLWHTKHSIEDGSNCNNPCVDFNNVDDGFKDRKGDFCSDTVVTEPQWGVRDTVAYHDSAGKIKASADVLRNNKSCTKFPKDVVVTDTPFTRKLSCATKLDQPVDTWTSPSVADFTDCQGDNIMDYVLGPNGLAVTKQQAARARCYLLNAPKPFINNRELVNVPYSKYADDCEAGFDDRVNATENVYTTPCMPGSERQAPEGTLSPGPLPFAPCSLNVANCTPPPVHTHPRW